MEEKTTKTSKVSTWAILGVLAVVAIIGVMMLKPKDNEMKESVSDEMTSVTPTDAMTKDEGQLSTISADTLAKHGTKDDCWIQIEGKVYDVTKIIPFHQGGEKAITDWCGKDGTAAFKSRNGKGPHPAIAMENLAKVVMGLFEVK